MSKRTEELAWAAGLFDGEGCTISGISGTCRYIQLEVDQHGNAKPEVLVRFQKAVGVGRVFKRGWRNPTATKTPWRYQLGAYNDVSHVVGVLWPYLGRVKRRQAKSALSKYRGLASRKAA